MVELICSKEVLIHITKSIINKNLMKKIYYLKKWIFDLKLLSIFKVINVTILIYIII